MMQSQLIRERITLDEKEKKDKNIETNNKITMKQQKQ